MAKCCHLQQLKLLNNFIGLDEISIIMPHLKDYALVNSADKKVRLQKKTHIM